jgi:hypothetical protein
MDYCDIDYLEMYGWFNEFRPPSEPERAMLTVHITQASEMIDDYCGRKFGIAVGEAAQTRTFTQINGLLDPYYRNTLWLDEDLYVVTSVPTADPLAVLTFMPSQPPYYAIKRDMGSWEDPTTITGFWAYANTPPATIVNTTARLAMWLYHQRESIMSEGSTVNSPNSIPPDIRAVLGPYKRVRLP